ncbi:MAG TPA: MXAN_5187 family protein [Myxococcales bacterium]
MARFKLPIFAVVVVALALAGLMYLGGRLSTLAGIQTTERLAWGQALFETSLRLAQSYRTSALAIAANDPAMAEATTALKDVAPAATLEDPVRKSVSAALERLPASLRRPAFFLAGNERGVAVIPAAAGAAEVRSDPGAFRLSVAGMTGPQGTHALVDGKLFAVVAAPLRSEGKNVGWLGAAFPLDDQFAAEQSKDLAMPVTLVAGSVVASSLPAAQRAAVGAAKDGPVSPLSEPPSMGPYFTAGAALAQAKSFALEGAEGARVVLVSEAPLLASLADYQKRGIFAILAVLAAALAFFFVGKSEGEAVAAPAPRQVEAPAAPGPSTAEMDAQNAAAEAAFSAFRESTGTPDAPAAPPPAAQPEPSSPFDAPPAAPPEPPPSAAEPAVDPFASAVPPAPAPFEPPPPSAAELAESAASSDPTAMVSNPYGGAAVPLPAPNPMVASPLRPAPPPPAAMAESPFDPFSDRVPESTVASAVPEDLLRQAARSPFSSDSPPPQSESTVVAQIPEELLRAARAHLARTAPSAGNELPIAASAPAMTPEETHFHEVFDQFVAMRSQCNEPADGLTYDKFSAKLRKNRDQLVVKYNCRAVRFQVYIKDGKAALKATPVRE